MTNICPEGFAIPDNPNDPTNWYPLDPLVNSCAVECKMIMFNKKEWAQLEDNEDFSIYLGFPLIVIMLIVWVIDPEKRKQHLVISFGVLSMLHTLMSLTVQRLPFEDRFCRSNTTLLNGSDGITFCYVQSVVSLYCGLALCICWMFQALGIYAKVVLEWHELPKRKWLHCALIFLLPLISVGIGIKQDEFGYSWAATGCFFSPQARKSKIDLYIFYLPLFVFITVGVAFMFRVIYKVGWILVKKYEIESKKRSGKVGVAIDDIENQVIVDSYPSASEGEESPISGSPESQNREPLTSQFYVMNESSDKSGGAESGRTDSTQTAHTKNSERVVAGEANGVKRKSTFINNNATIQALIEAVIFLKTPILFLMFFSVIYVSLIIIGTLGRSWYGPIIKSFQEWSACVLTNYDGSSDASYVQICGARAKNRVSVSLRAYLTILFSGQSFLCAGINFPGIYDVLSKLYKDHVAGKMALLWTLVHTTDSTTVRHHQSNNPASPNGVKSDSQQSFVEVPMEVREMTDLRASYSYEMSMSMIKSGSQSYRSGSFNNYGMFSQASDNTIGNNYYTIGGNYPDRSNNCSAPTLPVVNEVVRTENYASEDCTGMSVRNFEDDYSPEKRNCI